MKKTLALLTLPMICLAACTVPSRSDDPSDEGSIGHVSSALREDPWDFHSYLLQGPLGINANTGPQNVKWTSYWGTSNWPQLNPAGTSAPSLSNDPINSTTVTSITLDHTSRDDIFWLDVNKTLQHMSQTGGKDGSWTYESWGAPIWPQPGNFANRIWGNVATVSTHAQRVDVYATVKHQAYVPPYNNYVEDYKIWTRWEDYSAGVVSPWIPTPITLSYLAFVSFNDSTYGQGITATSWGPSRRDLFIRQSNLNGFVHAYSSDDGASWQNEVWSQPNDGNAVYGLGYVTSVADQRIDLFYKNYNYTGNSFTLRHIQYDHGARFTEDLGSPCPSGYYLSTVRGVDSLKWGPSDPLDGKVFAAVSCAPTNSNDSWPFKSYVWVATKQKASVYLTGSWRRGFNAYYDEPAGYKWPQGGFSAFYYPLPL